QGAEDVFYHARVDWPSSWRKWLPTDPTSAWWYDAQALLKLVYAHIAHAREGGRDLPLREFVRSFRGLTSTALAKQVCAVLPGIARLSDLDGRAEDVSTLLWAMKRALQHPPKAEVLGAVGKAAFADLIESGGRFWYEQRRWVTPDG